MASCGKHSEVEKAASNPFGFARLVCLVAVLIMLIGSAHAAVHDHDDNDGHEEDGVNVDCICCAVLALGKDKLSSDAASVIRPDDIWLITSHTHHLQTFDRRYLATHSARGPPLFDLPS